MSEIFSIPIDFFSRERETIVLVIALFLMIFGMLGIVFYNLKLLFRAFRTHFLWGLVSLLFPLVLIIFIFKHWEEAEQPFKGCLKSILTVVIGFAVYYLAPRYLL